MAPRFRRGVGERRQGDGAARRRDGWNGSWIVRWRSGGREARKQSKTFRTKAEADAFDQDIKRRKRRGEEPTHLTGRESFDDLYQEWWDLHAPGWSPLTQDLRESLHRKWVKPLLDGERLRSLSIERMIGMRNELRARGCSDKQVNKVLDNLQPFFSWLVESDRLTKNPLKSVVRFSTVAAARRPLTPSEVECLRQAMPESQHALAVSLMAYGGLRPGEVFALTAGDARDRVLVVRRSYNARSGMRPCKAMSMRDVPMIGALRDDVLAYLDTHEWTLDSPLIPNFFGQHWNGKNWGRRIWSPAIQRAGLQAKPYDLRHTYCSLLAHEGRSMPAIAQLMGQLMETQRLYSHVIEDARLAPGKTMQTAIDEARVHSVSIGSAGRHLRLVPDLGH